MLLGEGDAGEYPVACRRSPPAKCPAIGLGHCHFFCATPPLVDLPGRMECGHAGTVDSRAQIGELMLDGLETADGTAKLDAVLGVFHHHFQDFFRPADYIGALQDGGPLLGSKQVSGCATRQPKGSIGPQSNLLAPDFVLFITANGRHCGRCETLGVSID